MFEFKNDLRISLKILSPKRVTILAKKNLELFPLFVHIPLFIVYILYFEFQVYMFSNGRNMTKCHSFCTLTYDDDYYNDDTKATAKPQVLFENS